MNRNVNQVTLIGMIGEEDYRNFNRNNGTTSCFFKIALSYPVRNDDEGSNEKWKMKKVEGKDKLYPETRLEWIPIATYGNLAEICEEHLKKGMKVCVQGRIRMYTPKGEKYPTTQIVAKNVTFLTRPN